MVRQSSFLRGYVNGTLVPNPYANSTNFNTAFGLRIGAGDAPSGYNPLYYFQGRISNIRIVRGVAVYTGNFILPTSVLTSTQSAGTNISAITGTQTSLLTLTTQAATIAAQFGGTIISEQPSATPGQGARMCPHGAMTRIHGLTGKFGPYKGHFCPARQGDPTKCTTQYVKAGSPEFATFVADQTKA
jgi:hypothetical protein